MKLTNGMKRKLVEAMVPVKTIEIQATVEVNDYLGEIDDEDLVEEIKNRDLEREFEHYNVSSADDEVIEREYKSRNLGSSKEYIADIMLSKLDELLKAVREGDKMHEQVLRDRIEKDLKE